MGGWSCRAVAQQRPRVSKLGLKGASDYYSNEIALQAARLEASGLNKRAPLTKYLLKKNDWATDLSLIEKRMKGSPPEKIPLVRKSYSLYIWLCCRRELMKSVKMSENDDE
jgi:hypothetical protein